MREVYRFFGFGPDFINLLDTIGTNRTARVLLDNGRISNEFDLDRGFAQGNSPSPKKYNIGEQILLFRLEYDPSIRGVYNNFLIPRTVAENGTDFPLWETAERKGLTLDPELKDSSRKNSAFADDTTAGLLRTAENLSTVKQVLIDFGKMSGLETNVEKTTLMPIGNLDEQVPQDILDLGFEVVNEIKCLGIVLDNRAANLCSHFDGTIQKIRKICGNWSRYNLSLPGKISIAKTMLLSQVGYIGCIITPNTDQIETMQSIIDGFVTQNVVIANDRLYLRPNEGGLGLVKLSSYIAALQCSWIKRCTVTINDPWRWNLAVACNFNLDLIRVSDINGTLHPVLLNVAKSMNLLQTSFWTMHENFLMAPIVDNCFFLRAKPERRARNAGHLDRNFFGPQFYDENKEALRGLRLNSLIRNGHVISHNQLVRSTGINFNAAHYLNLQTACHFAVQKYGGKAGSNGSTVPLRWLFDNVKKGSRKFRIKIEWLFRKKSGLEELRVVKTFCDIVGGPIPHTERLSVLYGSWNWFFLGNRIRSFCFQFYNNSLAVGARLAARYEKSGIVVDSRCTFCVKSGSMVPNRESFIHIFYECPCINRTVLDFASLMLIDEDDAVKKRIGILTGFYDNVGGSDTLFLTLTSIFLCYSVWQAKGKKIIPSLASLCNDVDQLFLQVTVCSKKISELAEISNVPVCRRWRASGHGRG